MASLMLQYDRPTDHTRNWNDYNGRVRDWIARLLQTPGAVSFMAYRTADGASPNTITMLDFRTLEDARRAARSDHLKATSSHFGFLGCGGVGWLGWGRLRRCSAGRARWRPREGQGFQELGPGGEHNIGAQGLQVVEEAGSGSKRLAGVPPSA